METNLIISELMAFLCEMERSADNLITNKYKLTYVRKHVMGIVFYKFELVTLKKDHD